MSFGSAFKSFFEKVGSELKRIFGSTSWEQTAEGVITYVGPLVETLAQLTLGTAASSALTGVLNSIKASLATLSAVVKGAATPSGSTDIQIATAAINSVQDNLAGILADADIKNSGKVADIEATVTLIDNEMKALLANLPTPNPSAPSPVAA